MQFWKKTAAAAIAMAMLAGCSSSGNPSASAASAPADSYASASEGESWGPITVALTANLMTMDQALATDGSSFSLLSTCMSGLT